MKIKPNRKHVHMAITGFTTSGTAITVGLAMFAGGPPLAAIIAVAIDVAGFIGIQRDIRRERFRAFAERKMRSELKRRGLPDTAASIALLAKTLSLHAAETEMNGTTRKILCAAYDEIAEQHSK